MAQFIRCHNRIQRDAIQESYFIIEWYVGDPILGG